MLTSAATALLSLLAIAILLWRGAALRGTTLVHSLWWTAICLAALAGGEVLIAIFTTDNGSPRWASAVRLVTATSSFCPVMAVLGARRPHHHAWQFIVITMWIMLSLPAWEALFLQRVEAMDVGPVRGWFLWLMLVVNLLTYLPTRFFAPAILATLGQLILLGQFLPGIRGHSFSAWQGCAALTLFLVAVILASFCFPLRAANDLDRHWRSFRDRFGSLWAVRVMERINAAARLYDWPFTLSWSGFYFHDEADSWESLTPEVKAELQQSMGNLLRRFESMAP